VSRFADPAKFARLTVGPCECPGKPHTEGDWMDLRIELGALDMNKIAAGSSIDALELLILRWNFLDEDGTEAPTDREHVERLYADVFPVFNKWLGANVRYSALPNGSAAPSRATSRGSGSRTPTLTKVS